MSVAQNPITGQMHKSMANFSTYFRDGKNIVRSKAFNRKDANSDLQKIQRACFKCVVMAYQQVSSIAVVGFPVRHAGTSVYNAFISANLPKAVDTTDVFPKINYHRLMVAKGTLPSVSVTDVAEDKTGITIKYHSNVYFSKANETDWIVALAMTKDGTAATVRQQRGSKVNGILSIALPHADVSDIEFVYLFTLSANGKMASDSQFVEVV
jgi:hypothetical protein